MDARSDSIAVSIIAPVYQAAPFIAEFHARMASAVSAVTSRYEIILVNDGSTDETASLLQQLHAKDSKVIVINLSRNFGQLAAVRTGLSYAKGDYVYITDCDLEEDPEWFTIFFAELEKTSADIIFGRQDQVSPQTLIERIGGRIMRFIIRYFSDIPMIDNYVSARLMRRAYVDALLQFTERTGGFYILCQLAGFVQGCITVRKRYKGSSSYSLRKKVSLFIDHIISATNFPVACVLWGAAIILSVCSFWGVIRLLGLAHATPEQWNGWSIWFTSGLMLSGIGVIGLYASRILTETRQRPIAIVQSILEAKDR